VTWQKELDRTFDHRRAKIKNRTDLEIFRTTTATTQQTELLRRAQQNKGRLKQEGALVVLVLQLQ